VGFVLDQARRGAGARNAGCDITPDAVHAARQVTGAAAARLLPQSRRRVHVRLHRVCMFLFSLRRSAGD
jgi:hypothetical protein